MVQYGIAQQKIARLQDTFQEAVSGQVLLNMERSLATMREYQTARKKLESRRLTYDSALHKMQKAKREDSKAEEELRAARVRYEELSNDVQNRMLAIRRAETSTMNDLTGFIEAQAQYYQESSSIMQKLQDQLVCQRSKTLVDEHSTCSDTDTGEHEIASPSRLRVSQRRTSAQIATPLRSGMVSPYEQILPHDTSFASVSLTSIKESLASRPDSSSILEEPSEISFRELSTAARASDKKFLQAKFDFEAEASHELSIHRGDIISVLEETSSGWWTGQIIDHEQRQLSGQGLFPVNYCAQYTLPQPTKGPVRTPSRALSREESPKARGPNDTSARLSRQLVANLEKSSSTLSMRPPPPPIPKKKQGIFLASH